MIAIAAVCRPGFETDLIAERAVAMAALQAETPVPGLVLWQGSQELVQLAWQLWPNHPDGACFARDVLLVARTLVLPRGDRVRPLAAALAEHTVASVSLFAPDSEDAKVLAPMLKAVGRQLDGQWRRHSKGQQVRVLFQNSELALLCIADPEKSAREPGGLLRLKMPREAPSRSTLKLDEAFLTLLSEDERSRWLKLGQTACDLGASPGGWTWQLVQRGLNVTAVDNGRMDAALMDTGRVRHLREDAFRYRPKHSVDWLVCDVVEQPIRIAELVAGWLRDGSTRHAMFNLKLPMKKRWAEVSRCVALLHAQGGRLQIRVSHLYHDREEVTVFARRL